MGLSTPIAHITLRVSPLQGFVRPAPVVCRFSAVYKPSFCSAVALRKMGSHEPLFLRDLNDSTHRGTRTSEIGATAGRGSGSGRGLRARVDLRSGRSEPGSGLLRKIRIRSWQESEALNNAAMAAIINPTSNPVPPGGQQRGGQTEKETPDRMRCGGERRFRQECQTPAAPTLACSLDAADLPRAAPLACSCARAAGSRATGGRAGCGCGHRHRSKRMSGLAAHAHAQISPGCP